MYKKRKKRGGNISAAAERILKALIALCTTSVTCLSDLLKTVPHFNFRNNIINVLVPSIELSQDLSQVQI